MAGAILLTIGLGLVPVAGCGDTPRPSDASPIVTADSEPGRKALAEAAALVKLRQNQEATRKRAVVVPEG